MKGAVIITNTFDICDFGARSDSTTDCTSAIQAALDEAGDCGGQVLVPPGNYLCGMLRVPKGVALTGTRAWSFRRNGGSILTLKSADVPCLLDISNAFGCTVRGLCLAGKKLGEGIHGIMVTHGEYNGGGEEDTPAIEDCRVDGFSGDGVHLDCIWCFSIRHSMLCFNTGHGLYINGWDGFILDNWMSGNGGAGIFADKVAASVTMTGNRVEWNRLAGFYFRNSNTLNITGNYFDRSGGPALDLAAQPGKRTDTVAVTGNIFNRSGAGDFNKTPPANEMDNCHVRLWRCVNAVISGNTFRAGTNDGGTGPKSPLYGIVLERLRGCVVKDNAMLCASLKSNILDLGGHDEDVIIKDNAGSDCETAGSFWPSLRGEENI